MIEIDDKCLEKIVDILEGKLEVDKETRSNICHQIRRKIWVEREKQRLKSIRSRHFPEIRGPATIENEPSSVEEDEDGT